MLSLFPQILFLAPAGTALLRVVAGLAFLYMAHFFWNNQRKIAAQRLPLIGTCPPILTLIGSIVYAAIGVALAAGLWTQAAAVLAALGSLKGILCARRYAAIFPFTRAAYVFLFVMCLSLIVSGAGSFAFDLPL